MIAYEGIGGGNGSAPGARAPLKSSHCIVPHLLSWYDGSDQRILCIRAMRRRIVSGKIVPGLLYLREQVLEI